MSQTITHHFEGKVLEDSLDKLGDAFTAQITADPDVVLSNGVMEGGRVIAIDNWADVSGTVRDALRLWYVALQNKTALHIPIPVVMYNALSVLLHLKCSDRRGTVNFKPILDDFLPSDINDGYQQALFGETGYYSDLPSYGGLSYLEKGQYKPVILHKAAEVNKNGKRVETFAYPCDFGRIPVRVRDTTGSSGIYTGLDGYDNEASHLCYLRPTIAIDAALEDTLDGRLVKISLPGTPNGSSNFQDDDSHYAMALWATTKDHLALALRGFMQISTTIPNDFLTQIAFSAEKLVPYRALPSRLTTVAHSSLPVLAALARNHPARLLYLATGPSGSQAHFASKTGTQSDFRLMNSLFQAVRSKQAPLGLSEAVQTHRDQFMTYATGGKVHGVIMVMQTSYLTQSLDEAFYKLIIKSMEELNDLTLQLSACITAAPLSSLDLNALRLSPKYAIYVEGDSTDDKTGASVPLSTPTNYYTGGGKSNIALRLLQRFHGITDDNQLAIKETLDRMFSVGPGSLETSEMARIYREFLISKYGTVKDIDPDPYFDSVPAMNEFNTNFEHLVNQHWRDSFLAQNNSSLYLFTKLGDSDALLAVPEIAQSIFFPKYRCGTHCLNFLGYMKVARLSEVPVERLIEANLLNPADRTPVTSGGRVLRLFGVKGGFGFGSAIASVFPALGGLIGGLLGDKQTGQQIGGIAGQLGGGLLSSLGL